MSEESKQVEDEVPDPDYKIILLGDSAVGKSKLVERYLMDDYNPRQVNPPCSIKRDPIHITVASTAFDICIDTVSQRH